MRKIVQVLVLVLSMCAVDEALGQNLQLHYDYGQAKDGKNNADREYFTVTFEMFKPDKLGSTFTFVDFDFDRNKGGMSLAYWEIARKFTLPKKFNKFNFHLEYNGGFVDKGYTPDDLEFGIPSSFLTGIGYDFKVAGFNLSTSYLLKKFEGSDGIDGQFTLVWFRNFFDNKLTFNGFLDVWTEDKFVVDGVKPRTVLLTEPQLWYNVGNGFSFGGECEISKNFFTFDGDVEFMPTVAVKYSFN
ncbi:DUF5020 domain-containing protein [Fulvitalea axinellae]|uniref:DUF5020 domain-containing protein n=1 Tax=Fulvitalea axinellae TaxID=1182444 RepID=A0AAU9CL22_9BACT|nr:DUF5020 domain-containing protein [Fulvitalea axinellae]